MNLFKKKRNQQKELYDKYAVEMYNVCYRYIKDEQNAELVFNSGFLKVFQNIYKIKDKDDNNYRAWIKKIMINEALQFIRTNKKLRNELYELPDSIVFNENADSKLVSEDYHRLIRKLPDGYRTVFFIPSLMILN